MADYRAPRDDMDFVLHDVFNVTADWQKSDMLAEMMDQDTASAILDEAAKVAEQLIAPVSRQADEEGVSFNGGEVTTPAAYKENFRQLAEGGWVGVTANPDFGGMGLPKSLSAQYEGRCRFFSLPWANLWRHHDARFAWQRRHQTNVFRENGARRVDRHHVLN